MVGFERPVATKHQVAHPSDYVLRVAVLHYAVGAENVFLGIQLLPDLISMPSHLPRRPMSFSTWYALDGAHPTPRRARERQSPVSHARE